MGRRHILQKNYPLTTEIDILILERMTHWNFCLINKNGKWPIPWFAQPYHWSSEHAAWKLFHSDVLIITFKLYTIKTWSKSNDDVIVLSNGSQYIIIISSNFKDLIDK